MRSFAAAFPDASAGFCTSHCPSSKATLHVPVTDVHDSVRFSWFLLPELPVVYCCHVFCSYSLDHSNLALHGGALKGFRGSMFRLVLCSSSSSLVCRCPASFLRMRRFAAGPRVSKEVARTRKHYSDTFSTEMAVLEHVLYSSCRYLLNRVQLLVVMDGACQCPLAKHYPPFEHANRRDSVNTASSTVQSGLPFDT